MSAVPAGRPGGARDLPESVGRLAAPATANAESMALFARFRCARCSARMDLAELHVRVPRAGAVAGSIGPDRSEYRCRQCGQHHLLRPTRLALLLYPLLLPAALALGKAGIGGVGLTGFVAVGALAIHPFSTRLKPVR